MKYNGFEEWANKNGYAGNFPRKEHMRKSWNAAYKQAIDDAVQVALTIDGSSCSAEVAFVANEIESLKANLESKG